MASLPIAADEREPRRTDPEPARRDLIGPFGRRAIRLGRLFRIEVGLDWSWLFIFLLITWSLSAELAWTHDSWTPGRTWIGGLFGSLLFFTSILLHEFGHSLTSNALGVRVRSITLFIFGGLAQLSGEPKRPRDEFLIAAAGPLVSVVLGFGFLLAAGALPDQGMVAATSAAVFGWLGTVNLYLAAFNMVPGFPLDGGRLFRAALWWLTGDFEKATNRAAASGALFAMILIGGGLVIALLGGGFVSGLWLALIGWFLLNAARGSAQQVLLERRLGDYAVSQATQPLQPVIDGRTPVARAAEELIMAREEQVLFVDGDGGVAGLVTPREIRPVAREDWEATPVRTIMRPAGELPMLGADANLWQAMKTMNEMRVQVLGVERDGRLVGVLTRDRLQEIVQKILEMARS